MKKRWVLEEKIFQPLGKEKQKFLHLIRPAMIGVDNLVDKKRYSHKYFLRIIKLIKDTWNRRKFKTQNKYEKQFVFAICILRNLFDKGFYQAKQVYEDILKEYDSDYFWANSRNKILDSKTIKKFNTNIGSSVSSIFLYFQMPKKDSKKFKYFFKNIKNISKRIVQKYGFYMKLADNLTSLYKDIFEGFITIPKENIHKISGLIIKNDEVIGIDKKNLKIDKKHILKLKKEIELIYKEANRLLEKNRQKLGLNKQKVELFKEWARTWLEDVKLKV